MRRAARQRVVGACDRLNIGLEEHSIANLMETLEIHAGQVSVGLTQPVSDTELENLVLEEHKYEEAGRKFVKENEVKTELEDKPWWQSSSK
jgi:hypothetical protein